ncbi:hypothetical protein OAD50_04185 [Vicingaceae bacterium]|nr:hypothetical protein [Vicingaceae bacterium]
MNLKSVLSRFKTKIKSNPKVFVIGFNKTGTTTLKFTLRDLGYKIGNQRHGESIIEDWKLGNFDSLISLCRTADAFQDIPFSLPETYIHLYDNFENAKFVLSVRDDSDQWYQSICNFHSKLWAEGQGLPNSEQMRCADYLYKGYAYESFKMIFGTPDDDLYNKDILVGKYNDHNESVRRFFLDKSSSFLEVNVAKDTDYIKLCNFLAKEPKGAGFLWENETSKI